MNCILCRIPFLPEDEEEEICPECQVVLPPEATGEYLEADDFCEKCQAPIGQGNCPGCCAASCSGDPDEETPEACYHCGKELEDFSDLGCEHCDQRHPRYGIP